MFSREVRTVFIAAVVVAAGVSPGHSLAAQATGTIRGRILDAPSRQPLSDVRVSIEGTTLAAVSNQSGDVTIINVPAGQQTVRIRRLGYGSAERTVTVEPTGVPA